MNTTNLAKAAIYICVLFLICSSRGFAQEERYLAENNSFKQQASSEINQKTFSTLDLLKSSSEKFNLDLWYGLTFSDDNDESGIRRIDLKYSINKGNLIYGFYDDALALENKSIADIERTAPIVGAGWKHDWSEKFFTKAEIGRRFLSNEDDQSLFNLENVYFFSTSFLVKLVTQYDIQQNADLFTVGGLLEYELFKDFRVEGGFFHSQNLTLDQNFNERIMITPKLKIKEFEIIAGAYYDSMKAQNSSEDQFGGAYGLFVFPVVTNLKGKLFFNYDKGFFEDDIAIVSLGTNFKF